MKILKLVAGGIVAVGMVTNTWASTPLIVSDIGASILSDQQLQMVRGAKFTPRITTSSIRNTPKAQTKSTWDVAICGKIGAGASGKGCIGTSGTTSGVGLGVGVQVQASASKGWDGSTTVCSGVGGGGGATVYGTASVNVCSKNGKPVKKVSGGLGIGAGADGGGAAVYIQVTKTTPIVAKAKTKRGVSR